MMCRKCLMIFIVISFLFSCKSTKKTTGTLTHLKAEEVLANHYAQQPKIRMLKAQLIFKYKGKEELPSINASLRMIKDSVIWMSFSKLGFPVGKVMILPNRVLFYEKINKKYFDGDFRLISEQIGTEMDFNKIQRLFFGSPLFDLKSLKNKVSTHNFQYRISPRKKHTELYSSFWFDPVFFHLIRESFIPRGKQKKVNIDYTYSNKKESLNLPRNFIITLITQKGNTKIEVEFKKTETVSRLSFPFKLPENYKEIKLK